MFNQFNQVPEIPPKIVVLGVFLFQNSEIYENITDRRRKKSGK